MTRYNMTVTGRSGVTRDLRYYGGKLQEDYEIRETSIDTQYMVVAGFPMLSRQTIGLKEIRLSIDFFGDTDAEAYANYNAFCAEIAGVEAEISLPDYGGGASYTVIMEKVDSVTMATVGIVQAEFALLGVRHGSLRTVNSGTVNCESAFPETPCKITATVEQSGSNYYVGTVVFPEVTAGEVLTVDGLKGRILVNGSPAASRALFTKFPVLQPGDNTILCSGTPTVEYYPLYF